jgi:hypothetical protein
MAAEMGAGTAALLSERRRHPNLGLLWSHERRRSRLLLGNSNGNRHPSAFRLKINHRFRYENCWTASFIL